MDRIELYYAQNNEIFTDLILILIDDHDEITINLHKIILYSSCIYFKKLLTNCKEKHSKKIIMQVSNVFVYYDTIMSFYGQKMNSGKLPEWQHSLEFIKCFDFLGLKMDIDL